MSGPSITQRLVADSIDEMMTLYAGCLGIRLMAKSESNEWAQSPGVCVNGSGMVACDSRIASSPIGIWRRHVACHPNFGVRSHGSSDFGDLRLLLPRARPTGSTLSRSQVARRAARRGFALAHDARGETRSNGRCLGKSSIFESAAIVLRRPERRLPS